MLFNSAAFAVFFPVVTLLYFLLPFAARGPMLLAASCVFYAFFIPKYLLVLLAIILLDYAAGRLIERAAGRRRRWLLIVSLLANLGVLFFFKYWNFAASNLGLLAERFGGGAPLPVLDVLLPLGLSFHTFQSLAYTIEVYRGRWPAERSLPSYALYVLFYPQLVAGPIERPQNLLPQLHAEHPYRHADVAEGLRLMAWGFFKKVVIADRLALFVNAVYGSPSQCTGPALALATFFFAWQIYCDFSGYSDIAIGAARVMGYRLMANFDAPYRATSIADFWRRWHISLSTWFRDYVYIPLGGNRGGAALQARNLMITFLLSGLWHGASWGFVMWGALHGSYLVASRFGAPWRERVAAASGLDARPWLRLVLARASTFGLVCFAWIFFRAGDVTQAWIVIAGLPTGWPLPGPGFVAAIKASLAGLGMGRADMALAAALILLLVAAERLQAGSSLQQRLQQLTPLPRYAVYYATLLTILLLGRFEESQFLYFQF